MSRTALIVFVSFFLYTTSLSREINVKPSNPLITQNSTISILDVLTKDEGLCASGKPFGQSRYAKVCNNFEYPKEDVTLKSTNSEQFMCLGLYDRIYRLCHLDTLKTTTKSVLPENSDQFDKQVAKLFPKNGQAIFEFCKTWKNDYPPKYSKTEKFITQLEKVIGEPALCVKYCTADDASIVPLCVVLATMDNMSERTATGIQSVDATSQKKEANHAHQPLLQSQQSQDAVGHDPESAAADLQKLSDSNAHVETTIESAQLTKSTETKKKAELSKNHVAKLSQELPGAPITDLKSQQETSRTSPVIQAKKLGTDAKVDGKLETKITVSDKENGVKADQTAISGSGISIQAPKVSKEIGTPAGKAAIAQPADESAIASPAGDAAVALPTSDAALAPSGNEDGLARHDSGEDIPSEDITGLLDGDKLGSISQHTQDDPETEFRGAEGLDPATGESPGLVDEDLDQSAPIEPSEKRDFIPHMPSPNEDDSHFFGYFTVIGVMCVAGYVGYHNKQKILAMVLEGRRSRGGRSRRRPSTANYRKLDCTLEEAVTSQCNSNVTHVIY